MEKEVPTENSLFDKYKEQILKQPFMKNGTFITLLAACVILNLLILVTVFLGIKPEENIIQTRFNSFYGVYKTGSWKDFYGIFSLGLVVLVTNTFLAIKSYKKDKLISYFLLVLAIMAQLLIFREILNFIKLINL